MDTFWEYNEWKPTDAMMNIEPKGRPSKKHVEKGRKNLIAAARDVKDLPYWPDGWLARSAELLNLGFPDLAIADAHKAVLLCKAALDDGDLLGERARLVVGLHLMIVGGLGFRIGRSKLRREIQNKLRLTLCKAYLLEIDALKRLDATPDIISICSEAIKSFPNDLDLRRELEEARSVFELKVTMLEAQNLDFHDFK